MISFFTKFQHVDRITILRKYTGTKAVLNSGQGDEGHALLFDID